MKPLIRLEFGMILLVMLSLAIAGCSSTNNKPASYEKSKSTHQSQPKSYGY